MEFKEITVKTTEEGADIVTAVLGEAIGCGFSIESKKDFNEFLEGTELYWDYVDEDLRKKMETQETVVKFYLAETSQGAEQLILARDVLASLRENDSENVLGSLEITVGGIKEEDWANNWKQYFKPIEIGEKLVVKPSWENGEDYKGKTVLNIDPKSSFGTGQHETTSLCLSILEKNIKGGENVFDLGCGSGILSIASLLLGAEKALSIDIDENCIITTKENAEINGVSDRIEALAGNCNEGALRMRVTGEKYDVICANIVADVIISFLPLLEKVLNKNGLLMLSGIIDTRLSDVTDALKKYNFKTKEITKLNGWCAIELSI